MTPPKLKTCPEGGTGVHAWLFYACCACVEADMDDEDAEAYIEGLMTRPPQPVNEITSALNAARRGERPISKRWPTRNFMKLQQIFKDPPVDWEKPTVSAYEAVDALFPGDPLLCVGFSSGVFATTFKSKLRSSLHTRSLIVPSPMSALQGRTKAGHLSAHSLDNTGERRFIVVEFDWGTTEKQTRIIAHLAQRGPLRLVVHSGGKSVHAWFGPCTDETKTEAFFKEAVELGADHRLWLKSQFCRLPGGTRDGNIVQEILYFRP